MSRKRTSRSLKPYSDYRTFTEIVMSKEFDKYYFEFTLTPNPNPAKDSVFYARRTDEKLAAAEWVRVIWP